MKTGSSETQDNKYTELPDHLFASVVRSLYTDAQSMFLGMLCLVAAATLLYWKTQDPIQIVFAVTFLIVGLIRLVQAQAFSASVNDDTSIEEYKNWKFRYAVSGTLYFGILGSWFITCMIRSDDQFTHMFSLALCLCYMIGVIGRNFSSDQILTSQIVVASSLILAGFLYRGGMYNILMAAFLLPFFLTIRSMSTRLRQILFKSELAAQAHKTMAERFDIALDNVTHGIAMFDNNGKVVVANERFMEFSGYADWDNEESSNNDDKMLLASGSHNHNLQANIKHLLKSNVSARFRIRQDNDRTLEADYNAMSNGGVVVISDITESVRTEQVIRDLANYDPLTELPNRRHFVDEINKMLRFKGKLGNCAMFFLDLDKFKEINDTLGHAVGDKLLQSIAGKLKELVKDIGMICRFGGDEFVLVMPAFQDQEQCKFLAEQILKLIQEPITVAEHLLCVSASIGIAMSPKDGSSAEELLSNADAALYDAKAKGRSTFSFYSEELGEAIRMRTQLEKDLTIAINRNELQIYFQPLINLKRGRVTTCEALARWEHPQLGHISPEIFIKIAEEANIINQLGEYVLKRAIEHCKTWPNHVRVAVNVSSIQFQTSNMAEVIKRLLDDAGLPPDRLEIEITESVMLVDVDAITHCLKELSRLGVRISLDDFGTGFSSLSYLHTLPFDKVKIDRSFIENGVASDRSLTLLKGVVDLIKRLGLSVVLEGIENEKQMELLSRSVDVNEVQGYLFSRPLPSSDIKILLHESNQEGRDQQSGKVVSIVR
ncbi:MAG: EAL domain-containing protein [Rhizobiaceae bacterium]|nr:EAL domain-containing protein [Rhizobiaceae bacterium]